MRILLVEDEPTLAGQVQASLAAAGYALDMAADGLDAWHLGANEPYDAVVLDLDLPRVDGLSVLRRWRSEQVNVPVLILTARDSWTEKVEGIDAGADDYLAKPLSTITWRARGGRCGRTRRAHRGRPRRARTDTRADAPA